MSSTASRTCIALRMALAVLVLCLSAGCGGDGSLRDGDSSSYRRLNVTAAFPNTVTARHLAAFAAGSPKRALHEWFQAVQFEDVAAVRTWTSRRAVRRIGRPALGRAVATVGPALGRPNIGRVRSGEAVATVTVGIEAYVPGRTAPRSVHPVNFRLVREDDAWHVASLTYLLAAARRIEAAGLAPGS
jgi:hypothetical protein